MFTKRFTSSYQSLPETLWTASFFRGIRPKVTIEEYPNNTDK